MSILDLSQASPTCAVEIYSPTGQVAYAGGGVRNLTVQKSVTSASGTFTFMLAPNGSDSPLNNLPGIVIPMSTVLIGLQRGGRSNIVMVGVVTSAVESTQWTPNGVQRQIQISGEDFSYWFNSYNYYTLGFLGSTPGSLLGDSGVGGMLFDRDHHGVARVYRLRRPTRQSESQQGQSARPHQFAHRHLILL